MSHLDSGRTSAARVSPCRPRGGHRCFVDDVLRGMSRPTGAEGGGRPLSDAVESALRRQLGAQWVRIRAQMGAQARSGGPT